jgi:nitroimidazol reductase NimA-like FMN-containing flavoprotein (pyridoxamine 5'-phosphate oxidase superfamily)
MSSKTPHNPQPKAARPHMDGYGVPSSSEGMLPWDWARERFSKSHNYLISTVRPDGSPHVMPIWGIWLDGAFYLSTASSSRKGKNLEQNPACVVCSENADEVVILEGRAQKMETSEVPAQAFADYKAKYDWELDPKLGPILRVQPKVVFAMPEKDFPKGVTKWVFPHSD